MAAWGWSQLCFPRSRGWWTRLPAVWDLRWGCWPELRRVAPHVVWAPPRVVAEAPETGSGGCWVLFRPGPGMASLLPYSPGQAVMGPRFRTDPHPLIGGM